MKLFKKLVVLTCCFCLTGCVQKEGIVENSNGNFSSLENAPTRNTESTTPNSEGETKKEFPFESKPLDPPTPVVTPSTTTNGKGFPFESKPLPFINHNIAPGDVILEWLQSLGFSILTPHSDGPGEEVKDITGVFTPIESRKPTISEDPIIDTAEVVIEETDGLVPVVTESPIEPVVSSGYSGKSYGSAGRLRVPAVGLDVGLNYTECYGSYEQQMACQGVVDAWDSAGYFNYDGEMIIADHNGQGFSSIIGLGVGNEVDIDNPDGSTSTYYVVDSYASYNGDSTLGINHTGSIALYTCVSGWENIWVVEIQ